MRWWRLVLFDVMGSAEEWYVFAIKRALRNVKPGGSKRSPKDPITLMSSCSGSMAEASVLQAGGLYQELRT